MPTKAGVLSGHWEGQLLIAASTFAAIFSPYVPNRIPPTAFVSSLEVDGGVENERTDLNSIYKDTLTSLCHGGPSRTLRDALIETT